MLKVNDRKLEVEQGTRIEGTGVPRENSLVLIELYPARELGVIAQVHVVKFRLHCDLTEPCVNLVAQIIDFPSIFDERKVIIEISAYLAETWVDIGQCGREASISDEGHRIIYHLNRSCLSYSS